ncbi:ATP-dependent helicase HepA OS=Tsukamurella paurometabola OX=2061 GN=NCTC10741_03630 PE=4 SV=1 [Tsukamurella paurometabola]|uniref:SNF2-related protein n=1 Tax=Tsukamurella paurometabola TaxID=2061 RepID=UPI00019F028A|nr:SNF2-related protein [Tsukamurella paurometabola]SUP33845.1 SNF2 family N-terminal domain [Tsukamurella paurometabola]
MRCDLVDVTALPGAARPSASLTAWTTRSRGEEAPLPIAAHSEPDPTGTAVTSAAYAATAFADTVATATALDGTLDAKPRPYQAAGVAWLLRTLRDHGGALLADEMGLGKTLQAIGTLTRLGPGPHLVVCPTSLATNWRREIARFAPALLDQVTIVSYAGSACRPPSSRRPTGPP